MMRQEQRKPAHCAEQQKKKGIFAMKKFIVLVLLLTMTLSMVACGSTEPAATAAPSTAAAEEGATTESEQKVTVTLMTRCAGEDGLASVYDAQIAEFMEQNPSITVENLSIYEEDAYNTKLKSLIATGETPSIFYYPGIAGLTEWAKNGVILNVEPLFESDPEWAARFVDGALETYRLDSYGAEGVYAIPNELNVDGVFYNKALFEKAGITETPETMDDLYSCIQKLLDAGIVPWAIGEKSNWQMGHVFTNILTKTIGVEGQIQLGTGERKWTDADVVAALDEINKMVAAGTFEDGFAGIDYNSAFNMFLNGEAAMMTHSSPIITDIMLSDSENKDDFSFFPFPYFADKPEFADQHVVYSSSLMLSGTMSAEEQAAAIELVKYLTTPEAIQARYDVYRVAPYSNVAVRADAPQIFKDMISYTNTLGVTASEYFDYDTTTTLTDVSRTAIFNMALGSITAQEAAEQIQEAIDEER